MVLWTELLLRCTVRVELRLTEQGQGPFCAPKHLTAKRRLTVEVLACDQESWRMNAEKDAT